MATSYLQNNQTRALFLKRRAIFKQVLNLSLALVLMFFDYHQKLDFLRNRIKDFSFPMFFFSQAPSHWAQVFSQYMQNQQAVLEKNERLSLQILTLEAKLHSLEIYKYHHQKIKNWLRVQDPGLKVLTTANILSIDTNSNRHIYILNKGQQGGVFEGQVAIDGKGVIGQIINVGTYTSALLLITDAKSAVPVINKRTGEHGIVSGMNKASELQMVNVPKTSHVLKDDVLMTSGLGLIYPFGIPLGHVTDVKNIPGDDFLQVIVRPLGDLHKNHLVILLESLKNIDIWREELQQRVEALESLE